jgi:hypothetical protein
MKPAMSYISLIICTCILSEWLSDLRKLGSEPRMRPLALGCWPQSRYTEREIARGELSSHYQPPAPIGDEIVGFRERLFFALRPSGHSVRINQDRPGIHSNLEHKP